jgi:hypothetical protein
MTTTTKAMTRHTEPFAALPHHIAGDPSLSPLGKAVLLALLYWARDKDHCWPADASIGRRVGRSPSSVQRALRQLQGRGLIERQKTDANRTGRIIRLTFRSRTDEGTPSPVVGPPRPAGLRDERDVIVKAEEPKEATGQTPERPRPDPAPAAPALHVALALARVLGQVHRPMAVEPPASPPPAPAAAPPQPPDERPQPPRVAPSSRETARVSRTNVRSAKLSASQPAVPVKAPAVPLTPAEQARLAKLAPAARDKVLAWLATGDRVCLGEARRLLAPPRPPEPEPRTTADLLGRLPGRPDLVARAAQALAEDLDDARSWSYYAKLAGAVASRERPAEMLVEAWREARGPTVRSRGAIFVTSWRRSTRPSGP